MDDFNFDLDNDFPRPPMPRKKKKNWIPLIVIVTAVVLVTAAVATLFIIRPAWFDYLLTKRQLVEPLPAESVIVPWNPGGTADLVTRALINQTAPNMSIQNMHGANGTLGLKEVYNAPHDGKTILGTNISAFVSAQMMGFTDISHTDWDVWLMAYAPSLIVVKSDSPYNTAADLLAARSNNPEELRCANAGNGSLSFIAAHLFAEAAKIDFKHVVYSGSNPAINALISGEADFAVVLSTEVIDKLRSGELRALAAMYDSGLDLKDVSYSIPSIVDVLPEAVSVTPFGEAYGILIPKDTSADVLNKFDRQWKEAEANEVYIAFSSDKGLFPMNYDRSQSAQFADKIAGLVCWTLYDTECVNVSPDTLKIPRP